MRYFMRVAYGVVSKDLGSKEGVVFRKASVIKDKHKLGATIEGLKGMRDTAIIC